MNKFSKFVVPVVCFSMAMSLAACGGSSDDAQSNSTPTTAPKFDLASSVDKTTQAATAKTTMNVDVKASDAKSSATITADGSFDFTKKQGSQDLNISVAGQTVTLPTVIDGTTVYEKLPAALTGAPSDRWIKINTADVAALTGNSSLTGISGEQSNDPTQGLSMLTAASDNVQKVGTEQVRDAATTHYKAVLDFKTAAANTQDPQRKAALEKVAQLYKTDTVPADVWVDDQGRVRKMTYVINTGDINVGTATTQPTQRADVTTTVEFYDFGTPVSVTVPTGPDVVDFKDFGNIAQR